ncbi:hypothetical protein B0G76_8420 [Paraburkholderia sp. BL23I1N1]|uniref:hypothetical protein n=1 Tax=Paraburkholderia sp. BL23I1N1 TaxID=1938802 RepID=UPI000FF2FCBB|nr:hypothetical protein [Paraburkholderia sp. BL23I1N1]RKE23740.1 hypothetical protein B0G76_8420 [Paraburkholderia sp. BL23I1N1]
MTNVTNIDNSTLAQILGKARDAAAAGEPGGMSTGEALAVALVLNRPDWLAAMNFTIAEAIERIGPEWAQLVPAAARQFTRDSEEAAYAAVEKARNAKLEQFTTQQATDEDMEFAARIVTCGDAPGYRDVYLTLDLEPIDESPKPPTRARISFGPEDGEKVVRYIKNVHRFAWDRSAGRPIDAASDEQRPDWID